MDTPLEAWRDTLKELGVMGLVRPEMTEVPVAQAFQAGDRRLTIDPGERMRSPGEVEAQKPEARRPAPEAQTYAPPTDPIGCPPDATVAGAATLADLETATRGCLKCALGPGRISFVFGEGDPAAGLMFIGEGPGRDEDLQGRPFVGKAGELLDKMIGAIGLSRPEVYIANVVKCLRYNTLVLLEDGSWERIGRLVARNYAGKVMSVDATGRVVAKAVTGWHKSPLGDRRMFRIRQAGSATRGGGKAATWLTHDHEVLTRRGWIRAEHLEPGDEIALGLGLSRLAEQVVLGSLLGDGHISARSSHLSIIHSAQQSEWLKWKANALQELHPLITQGASRAQGKSHPTARLRTQATRPLRLIRATWYPDGKKRIPSTLRLTPLILAVWFLDDGHLRIRPGKAPLAELACHGFSQEDRQTLIHRLAHDLGLAAYQRPKHPGRIHFSVEATRALSGLIAPFVPDSMRRKLHPESRSAAPFEPMALTPDGPPQTYFDQVLVDRDAFKGTDKTVFCLDVEETHSFVTSGGVVHNCRPPDNRTPHPDEAAACLGYLRKQIELIRPKVIVTLGATPLRELVGVKEGITRIRGQWKRVEVAGRAIPVMPTFHPAYVLRQYTQDVRRAVWEDLKAAKEEMGKA